MKKFISYILVAILFCVSVASASWYYAASGGGSTFTFVAYASGTTENGTSVEVNKPTGTTENDIMIAIISHVGPPAETPSCSGWTRIQDIDYRSTSRDDELLYKVAGGAEGASYTFSGYSTSGRIMATIATYRGGFNTSDPIDTYSKDDYVTSNTTNRATALTVSAANSPIFHIGSDYHDSSVSCTAPSSPGTFNEDVDNYQAINGPGWVHCFYSQEWSGSGSTGDMDATLSVSETTDKAAFGLALNPD